MRNVLMLAFVFICAISFAQVDSLNLNPNYNAELARQLQADELGMRSYVLVIFKSGSNLTENPELKTKSFRGHFENINKLVLEKKLVVAGPIAKNANSFRGLFILNVVSFDEAKVLLKNDLAVQNGFLDYDLYTWYGSAALPLYLKESDKIWKKKP